MGDFGAALGLAYAVMAAIYWRSVSGLGQHIDMSKQEWSMNLHRIFIPRYKNEGKLESRATQIFPWAGTMKCKDGYICMLPDEEHHWKALVEWMGNPEWASDPRFQRAFDRSKNGVELTKRISEWVSDKSKHDLQKQGQARGVPIAMFSTVEDILESEQLRERGFFVDVDHPKVGRQAYPFVPYKFSATLAQCERPTPTLGQHNGEIYEGLLGYSADDLTRLRTLGVI